MEPTLTIVGGTQVIITLCLIGLGMAVSSVGIVHALIAVVYGVVRIIEWVFVKEL